MKRIEQIFLAVKEGTISKEDALRALCGIGNMPNQPADDDGKEISISEVDIPLSVSALEISADAFFVNDHVVGGVMLLPAAAQLEFLREAIQKHFEPIHGNVAHLELDSIIFLRPFAVKSRSSNLTMILRDDPEGGVVCDLCCGRSEEQGEDSLLSQARGRLVPHDEADAPSHDFEALRPQCVAPVDVDDLYRTLAACGIELGSRMRGLASAAMGATIDGQPFVLAELAVPSGGVEGEDSFIFHPTLVDGAFQSAAVLAKPGSPGAGRLPFSIERVEVWSPIPENAWAYTRAISAAEASTADRFDIDLCDASGRVCCRIRAFSTLPSGNSALRASPPSSPKNLVTKSGLKAHVAELIRSALVETLKLGESGVEPKRPFADYGVDSIIAIKLTREIGRRCGIVFPATTLFDFNSVDRLTRHILDEHSEAVARLVESDLPSAAAPDSHSRSGGIPSASSPIVRARHADDEPDERVRCRRAVVHGSGNIEDIEIVEEECPPLGRTEVRIAVHAFPINFMDLLCVQGLYPTIPGYPFTPGTEVSGVVIDVGSAVHSIRPGDEVVAVMGQSFGGQATVVTVDEAWALPKPSTLSFEEACALPAAGITMLEVFERIRLRPGERILIQGATGGLGTMAIQLARHFGGEVFATAGSDEKLDYLAASGAARCCNHRTADIEREIKQWTDGAGVDVVINTLAEGLRNGLTCLAPGGRYVELAMTALKSARAVDLSVLNDNQTFFSVDVRKLGSKAPEKVLGLWRDLSSLAAKGGLRPNVEQVFSFDRLKDAYRRLESRESTGKIVVGVDSIGSAAVTSRGRRKSAFSVGRDRADQFAIIGMSGRYPRSENLEALWRHLAEGEELTRPSSRWDLGMSLRSAGVDPETACNRGGYLSSIDMFDPLFFNISKLEATYLDPQQRLFMQEAWKALEDAGYAGDQMEAARCGVYIGCAQGDYGASSRSDAPAQAFWGNAGSVIPARIAYHLDLRGPAIAIDTACSSSLVAIHLACQALRSGEIGRASCRERV